MPLSMGDELAVEEDGPQGEPGTCTTVAQAVLGHKPLTRVRDDRPMASRRRSAMTSPAMAVLAAPVPAVVAVKLRVAMSV